MKTIILKEPLVSAKWLYDNLSLPNLIILDARIKKVTNPSESTISEFQIPKARFFDIKKAFSNVNAPFPNTMPSEEQFNEATQALGINNDSAIVIYDDKGIYSSARAWYMFKAMGHNNVSVLDGGFPEWQKLNYDVIPKSGYQNSKGSFIGKYNTDFFENFDNLVLAAQKENVNILDARSSDRFNSLVPEPREGLRSGNIPGSSNLPYTELFQDGKMKSEEELLNLFTPSFSQGKEILFSCGSGITACILALGSEICGFKNYSVYDGSWTEWGSLTEA